MAITHVETIKCDGPECNKVVSYPTDQQAATFQNPANVWLKSLRMVQTLDQRKFSYCSDVCEIMAAKSGQHNPPQPKAIIENATAADVNAAAAAADAAAESDKNLKSGGGGNVIVAG